jgi:hypothetical protein
MSDYIGDGIINPSPPFRDVDYKHPTASRREVNIRVPLSRDVNTPEFAHFEGPVGDDDGCCGSDSQQVRSIVLLINRRYAFLTNCHFISSGGMDTMMTPRRG